MKPTVFFGRRDSNQSLRAGVGYADGDEAFDMRLRPNPIAPADVGGECTFHAAHIAVVFSLPFRARVTPVLDGIPYYDESVLIENQHIMTVRERHIFECRFSKTVYRDGNPIRRHAFRGTWFTVEIGVPCPVEETGDLIFEGIEIEHDTVSRSAGAGPQ